MRSMLLSDQLVKVLYDLDCDWLEMATRMCNNVQLVQESQYELSVTQHNSTYRTEAFPNSRPRRISVSDLPSCIIFLRNSEMQTTVKRPDVL